jgi:ABC-type oligopeptide transport system ATPase subunit
MSEEALFEVRRLSKQYGVVRALNHVGLAIPAGSTLALVGQSGSGKSTLARCVARLEDPTSGEIWFEGHDIARSNPRALRGRIQLIFQDPATSLNPRFSATNIVAEPLVIQGWGTRRERRERALDLMRQVGLAPEWGRRLPLEFSGGQRQRLAIARALALEPKLLILDEALSGLDLSTQAQIVNLLLDLQRGNGLAYLYISHDLVMAAHLADEIAVIYQGAIVERASPAELFDNPRHAHTRALLASIPAA